MSDGKELTKKIRLHSRRTAFRIRKQGRRTSAKFNRFRKKVVDANKIEFMIKHVEMILLAVLLGVFFLLFELVLRVNNLYQTAYWVDVPSHFLGGIALASLAIVFIYLTKIKKKNLFAVFFVLICAVGWEILETLEDWLIPQPIYLQDFFFWDGFWDIIFTTLGGITFLVIFNKYIRKRLGHLMIKYLK